MMGTSNSRVSSKVSGTPYPFFLFEQESMETLLQRVKYLEEMNWIDHQTTMLDVKMVFVNEDVKLIQHLKIRFLFPASGGISSRLFFQSSYTDVYQNPLVWVCDFMWL